MIYTKRANFPFPLLTNTSDDYKKPKFDLDIELEENTNEFILSINADLSSTFIKKLIREKRAQMVLIIKSKDCKYYYLEGIKSTLRIPKNKLSLGKKTVIQAMIRTSEDISFAENEDLNEFFDDYKSEIVIHKGNSIGFSNTINYLGQQKKPYELFEKKVDKTIDSDIKIELDHETIRIVYKSEEMQFNDLAQGSNLTNPYIYMGLQKALFAFLIKYTQRPEDGLELCDIGEISSPLDEKLLLLMSSKRIDLLTLENIDEVIHLISDNIIKKYVDTVRGLSNGN